MTNINYTLQHCSTAETDNQHQYRNCKILNHFPSTNFTTENNIFYIALFKEKVKSVRLSRQSTNPSKQSSKNGELTTLSVTHYQWPLTWQPGDTDVFAVMTVTSERQTACHY